MTRLIKNPYLNHKPSLKYQRIHILSELKKAWHKYRNGEENMHEINNLKTQLTIIENKQRQGS